ncbi:MAG: hypothetical protein PQJ60_08395 [Spirochaetales bacterium]|nr:hypothetical protein [Spirochaetales bacterium]
MIGPIIKSSVFFRIKWFFTLPLVLFCLSCGQDPVRSNKELKQALKELDGVVSELNGKNLTSSDILEGLDRAAILIDEIQEAREKMAEEAGRLTRESYELNSKEIELLKEGRLTLYEGVDDFLVCSYRLSDLIEQSRYYHDRGELRSHLEQIQYSTISLVQRDAPHSRKSTFSYYKNLSKITSQTADPEGHWFYTIKVNVGYNYNEKETQTLLNSSKVAMGGIVRSYFSGLTKDYVLSSAEEDVKAGLVMALNDYLIQFADFRDEKMEGVKLVTFDIIQYYEFH